MESLVDKNLFSGIYKGKKVFLTGHSGFKGSWMALWLKSLGAEVCGYSLTAPTTPNHIGLLDLDIFSNTGDVRDLKKLKKIITAFDPDIVFHMAAQPLVRLSYREPLDTFETNIMGSLKLYEACREVENLKAIVSITTDKVYDNKEWIWGYRENDALGGLDPYSASKGAMEIVTNSYRHSFFNMDKYKKDHNVLLTTVRAGNVIGGGDWALDRLIPDIIMASLKDEPVEIRSPYSTRPWQHVLEPLSGYLLMGQRLLEEKTEFANAFNFGPDLNEDMCVKEVVETLKKYWEKIDYKIIEPKEKLHEANLLKLDCTKAFNQLLWRPVWSVEETLKATIEWYRSYYEKKELTSDLNLKKYISDATEKEMIWTKNG